MKKNLDLAILFFIFHLVDSGDLAHCSDVFLNSHFPPKNFHLTKSINENIFAIKLIGSINAIKDSQIPFQKKGSSVYYPLASDQKNEIISLKQNLLLKFPNEDINFKIVKIKKINSYKILSNDPSPEENVLTFGEKINTNLATPENAENKSRSFEWHPQFKISQNSMLFSPEDSDGHQYQTNLFISKDFSFTNNHFSAGIRYQNLSLANKKRNFTYSSSKASPHGLFYDYHGNIFNFKFGIYRSNTSIMEGSSPLNQTALLDFNEYMQLDTKDLIKDSPAVELAIPFSRIKITGYAFPRKKNAILPPFEAKTSLIDRPSGKIVTLMPDDTILFLAQNGTFDLGVSSTTDYGSKIQYNGSNFDFSLNYFTLHAALPFVTLSNNAKTVLLTTGSPLLAVSSPGPTFIAKYPLLSISTLDFSSSLAGNIFKGEFSQVKGHRVLTKNLVEEEVTQDHFSLACEFYFFGDFIRTNIEGNYQRLNTKSELFQVKSQTVISANFESDFGSDEHVLSLLSIHDLSPSGHALKLKYSYKKITNLNLSFSYTQFNGHQGSIIGHFNDEKIAQLNIEAFL